jgi:sugar lactone lactonase YvrE
MTIGIGLLLIASMPLAACRRGQSEDVHIPSPTHLAPTTTAALSTATVQHVPRVVSSPSPTVRDNQIEPDASIPMDNPRAVAIGSDGTIYVADSGDPSEPFPGKVLRISPMGKLESILAPFSAFSANTSGETYVFGLSGVASSAGTLYVLLGVGAFLQNPIYAENHLVSIAPDGAITQLFSLAGFEAEHDPDGAGIDSNATGLAYAEDGSLWVTDAAGNWAALLIPSHEAGEPMDVAAVVVFPSVDGEDAVPTGIAVGPDGNAYVALFRCQQPTDGKGGIARIHPDGEYEIVVEGLSNPIDVGFDAAGRMYVLEFATDYAPGTGRLLVVREHGRVATVLDGLTFPTSLAISEQGTVYITEIASPAGGAAGSGRLLAFHSLAN